MKRWILLSMIVLLVAAAGRSARADHDTAPDRRDMREVRSLADDLEDSAEDLLHEVERTRPRNSYGPDRALEIVRRFYYDARAFSQAVGDNYRTPEQTLIAYRRMHASYDRLSHRTEQVYVKPRAGRHLERIHELVARIDRYYRDTSSPRVDWERVAYLAHQMDVLAGRIYHQANEELVRRAPPQYDWRSREILNRLAELREAADEFHEEVEERRPGMVRVRAEFDRLHAAQQAASTRIWSLEYRTRSDFYRLTDYMYEVRVKCFGRDRDDRFADGDHGHEPDHGRPAGSGGPRLGGSMSAPLITPVTLGIGAGLPALAFR